MILGKYFLVGDVLLHSRRNMTCFLQNKDKELHWSTILLDFYLKQTFIRPFWVDFAQFISNTVVFSHKHRVNARQSSLFVSSNITWMKLSNHHDIKSSLLIKLPGSEAKMILRTTLHIFVFRVRWHQLFTVHSLNLQSTYKIECARNGFSMKSLFTSRKLTQRSHSTFVRTINVGAIDKAGNFVDLLTIT